MDLENRVVVLIDMDCFYCQVEEKLNPDLKGKPIAVVQYNPWKGGGIIAVNYVARAMGVSRHMRGDEAKEKCPEIQLPSVPCQRGKADISKYRDAGKEVAKVLQKFSPLLERASIDEAYLDITAPVQERLKSLNIHTITTDLMPHTYTLGYESIDEFLADVHSCGADSIDFDYDHALQLLVGSIIVSEIRTAVFMETGYSCSAGIAHNKILAKLVCGMNKPNKQTILPKHSINILYKTLLIKKVKHLGGKFGDAVCEILKIKNMAQLQDFSEKELQSKFDEKNGTWLYNIARGTDLEPVQARFNPKSIGCCKQFRGKSALQDLESLKKWLNDLGDEIEDRLEKDALENNRTPKQMVVSYHVQLADGRDTSSSRSYNFVTDDELCSELLSSKALELLMDNAEGVKVQDGESNRKLKGPIKFLGISVGKFEDNSEKKTRKIIDYFSAGPSKDITKKPENKQSDIAHKKINIGKEYILEKFFKVSEKKETETEYKKKVKAKQTVEDCAFQTTLDLQESFFAKMLHKKTNYSSAESFKPDTSELNKDTSLVRPSTPVCNVVNCGENSNDTDYSSSTINMEINRSIALFEEDPEEVARVSNIRQLLNNSSIAKHAETLSESNTDDDNQNGVSVEQNTDMFKCPKCDKTLAINLFEEHADYHIALAIRDEERQLVCNEKKEKTDEVISSHNACRKSVNCIKNESLSTITNFFVKIDHNKPAEICAECGKKIALELFAEHLDFHEAQKVSKELNGKNFEPQVQSSVKRKRSKSPVKKTKIPCKSIDMFFR